MSAKARPKFTTPLVKMYKCNGCGQSHPYSCQKLITEQLEHTKTEMDALRTVVQQLMTAIDRVEQAELGNYDWSNELDAAVANVRTFLMDSKAHITDRGRAAFEQEEKWRRT